jgi:hypothetical protein
MVQKNQGLNKVEKILDMLILTEGTPNNWETFPSNPDVLGLASSRSTKMNQLGREKVQRLSSNSPFYLSPTEVRNLLGLSSNYYISIKIHPLLNISVERYSMSDLRVQIFNQWRSPVPNVEITAAYYFNQSVSELTELDVQTFLDDNVEEIYVFTSKTNSLGLSSLDLSSVSLPGSLLIKAEELTSSCVSCYDLNTTHVSEGFSQFIIPKIELSMGSVSGYNSESVYRNVEIDELNYIIRFTLWSGG